MLEGKLPQFPLGRIGYILNIIGLLRKSGLLRG
jgi:hypothetical protein